MTKRSTTNAAYHPPTQREKTQRAFRAYCALVDTADWIRGRLRGQLETFNLTMPGFRLLETLYREGPSGLAELARRQGCTRQNLDAILARLEERGWVRQEIVTRPPVEMDEKRLPKALRGRRRKGPRAAMVHLTPLGEKFMGVVLPKHAKTVKAMMRCLDAREQESLSRICAKLREGDPVKFITEMRYFDEDEKA